MHSSLCCSRQRSQSHKVLPFILLWWTVQSLPSAKASIKLNGGGNRALQVCWAVLQQEVALCHHPMETSPGACAAPLALRRRWRAGEAASASAASEAALSLSSASSGRSVRWEAKARFLRRPSAATAQDNELLILRHSP